MFFPVSVVVVSRAPDTRSNPARLYSPVFERRRHFDDRHYNDDNNDEEEEDRFGWTFDEDDHEHFEFESVKKAKQQNDDPVPRRDLTQCLQETLIASTSNLSGVPRTPKKLTGFQRTKRRLERFCLDFGQCWRGMSTWLAKKFPSRSKRIDVVARILFPLVFAIFNFSYWTFYLLQHESSKFNWKSFFFLILDFITLFDYILE